MSRNHQKMEYSEDLFVYIAVKKKFFLVNLTIKNA